MTLYQGNVTIGTEPCALGRVCYQRNASGSNRLQDVQQGSLSGELMAFKGLAVFSAVDTALRIILLFAFLLLPLLVLPSFPLIVSWLRRLADPRSVLAGSAVDKVPLGQDFLLVVRSFPVSRVPAMLIHTALYISMRLLKTKRRLLYLKTQSVPRS